MFVRKKNLGLGLVRVRKEGIVTKRRLKDYFFFFVWKQQMFRIIKLELSSGF